MNLNDFAADKTFRRVVYGGCLLLVLTSFGRLALAVYDYYRITATR